MPIIKRRRLSMIPAAIVLLSICIANLEAYAQRSGIVTIGLNHNINYTRESDSLTAFRTSNASEASTRATIGTEISLAYEWFLGSQLSDSASTPSVQLALGFLQRGYRTKITTTSTCLANDWYAVGVTWLRVGVFGRDHIPIAKKTSLILQLGATFGYRLSAGDNIDDLQKCAIPTEALAPIVPSQFIEAGAGIGIQRMISPRAVGQINLLYFYPLATSASVARPATEGQIRSTLIDISTSSIGLNLSLGWMF